MIANDKKLVKQLVVMACIMFAFGFALVPLYDIFCEVTGFRTSNEKDTVEQMTVDAERTVDIEFIASAHHSIGEETDWDR